MTSRQEVPVPLLLWCPACHERHVDEGELATRPHRTHACQGCGFLWAPAVVPTVGVRFLPGCRGEVAAAPVVARTELAADSWFAEALSDLAQAVAERTGLAGVSSVVVAPELGLRLGIAGPGSALTVLTPCGPVRVEVRDGVAAGREAARPVSEDRVRAALERGLAACRADVVVVVDPRPEDPREARAADFGAMPTRRARRTPIRSTFADFQHGDFPWDRGRWFGSFVSLDGAPATDLTWGDVEEVVWHGEHGDSDWTISGGVARLRDGRYCAWESEQGPTGTGFSGDAYGGTADVAFASKEVAALRHVSDSTRERMVRVALRRGGGS